MEKEILEGNKLIAEFMGYKSKVGHPYFEYPRQYPFVIDDLNKQNKSRRIMFAELKYDSSWDWLMPVRDKISALGYKLDYKVYMDDDCIVDVGTPAIIVDGKDGKRKLIEVVWLAIIEFIKWYNQGENKLA